MLYDPSALWSHHFLSVAPALFHGRQDSLFGRVSIVGTAVDEDRFYELFHLLFQLFIGNRLVEQRGEFPIRALETAQQLVSNEFGRDSIAWNIWGFVGLGHRARL